MNAEGWMKFGLTYDKIATRSSSRNSSNSRDHPLRSPASNKDLPPVPSERPPFLIIPNNGSATPSYIEHAQRQRPSRPMHRDQNHVIASPDSNGTPERSGESTSSGSPDAEPIVRRPQVNPQSQSYQGSRHSAVERGRATPQASSSRTSRMFGHGRVTSSKSPEETAARASKRVSVKSENGEHSLPPPAKDSAYSSVVASPTAVPSRTASGMSSPPQAQFGLFPSSTRSTPKGSISGRVGAMSPVSSPPLRSAKSSVPASRPETTFSDVSDADNKRLSKRSSFTSLKRFFTTKKRPDINSIAE